MTMQSANYMEEMREQMKQDLLTRRDDLDPRDRAIVDQLETMLLDCFTGVDIPVEDFPIATRAAAVVVTFMRERAYALAAHGGCREATAAAVDHCTEEMLMVLASVAG